MAKESIRLIEQAESEALELERQAYDKASEIVTEARERSAQQRSEAITAAKRIVEQTIEASDESGKALIADAERNSRKQCEQLKADAGSKLDAAADMIIADIFN